MVDLSITVLHFNRWDLTKYCLASIDAQEIPCSYEKVLVDNGSTLRLQPETIPTGWKLVSYPDNWGHIKGQNRCFESARGEWVLFVANDVRLYDLDCIRELWRFKEWWQKGLSIGQIQPMVQTATRQVDQLGMDWKWPGYGISRKVKPLESIQIVPSTCYLMRKNVWKCIGGFDETLGSSHEDVDMGLRLLNQGCTNLLCSEAEVVHLGNATLKHTLSNHRQVFHQARLKVIRKHYQGWDRLLRLAAVYLLDAIPRP